MQSCQLGVHSAHAQYLVEEVSGNELANVPGSVLAGKIAPLSVRSSNKFLAMFTTVQVGGKTQTTRSANFFHYNVND